jgi:hypothetical protein
MGRVKQPSTPSILWKVVQEQLHFMMERKAVTLNISYSKIMAIVHAHKAISVIMIWIK